MSMGPIRGTQVLRTGRGGARRGSAYALVLAISMLVLVIGAGAIAAARVESRASEESGNIAGARGYALSGVEGARLWIAMDANWRTTFSNGVWATDRAIGDGSVTVEVVNPAGALDRSPADPVVVTATGKSGKARHKVQVTLASSVSAISCLEAAVCAGGLINLNSSTVNGPNQLVASNAAVLAVAATVNANVEAALTVTGVTYNGSTKNLCASRQLPDATVYDWYIANGTAIDVNSLDSSGGSGMKLHYCVLSPGSNPFGATKNPYGIYVIDCQGLDVIITSCRIVGTLVLTNPGSGSVVQGSVNWAPTGPGMPCLLVKGNISLSFTTTLLSETVNPKTNYNPTGTPYPYSAGVAGSDADKVDSYPSLIDGLVYVSGNVTTSGSPTVDSLIVGGTWSAGGTLTLNYDGTVLQNPPQGFGGSAMAPILGTWKQVVD